MKMTKANRDVLTQSLLTTMCDLIQGTYILDIDGTLDSDLLSKTRGSIKEAMKHYKSAVLLTSNTLVETDYNTIDMEELEELFKGVTNNDSVNLNDLSNKTSNRYTLSGYSGMCNNNTINKQY